MRTGVRILLSSGLVVLSLLFIVSCRTPAVIDEEEEVAEEEEADTTPTEVRISGFVFQPETITVAEGATITWTNLDSVSHTVTSETDLFGSANLGRDASFSYSFTEPGTFSYFCAIHPYMRAEVIVE
jgi:plastocyanin